MTDDERDDAAELASWLPSRRLRARVAELEAEHEHCSTRISYAEAYAGEVREEMRAVTAERDQLRAASGQLMSAKDSAYTERNRCVAAIARLALANGWRAGLGSHQGDDLTWDPEWRTIVFIDLPAGQVSWHLHDSEVALFEGLPPYPGFWDGHTTEEKYARLAEVRRWRSSITADRDAALATLERVRAELRHSGDEPAIDTLARIEAALASPR